MTPWQRLSTIDQFTASLRAKSLSEHWAGTMPGVHRLVPEFSLNSKTVEAARRGAARIDYMAVTESRP